MLRSVLRAIALSSALTLAGTVALASSAPPPLIPRAVLFSNPEKLDPAISPDGRKLAYLALSKGSLAIWVRTLGASDAKVVAAEPKHSISSFLWQGDSRHVFYLYDKTGRGSSHIMQANVATAASRDLTPDPTVRANIEDVEPSQPGTILISTNERDKGTFDVYRLDVQRGLTALDTRNPGNVDAWFADNALVVRASVLRNRDGSSVIQVRENAAAPWRTLVSFSPDDRFVQVLGFSADGRSLFVIDAKNANAARLMRYDIASGDADVVFSDPTFDVTNAFIDPQSHEISAIALLGDRLNWRVIDHRYDDDFAALRRLHAGDFEVPSVSADGKTWIVSYTIDDGSQSYYAFERATKRGVLLFAVQPNLAAPLAKMAPIAFKARDGLDVHGYVTLPLGLEPRGLPTILLVHGGPWARDTWGNSGLVQWLANRGYAVLQVNFRGSTGYGKTFLNAGARQWAGAMRTDLLDARDWAVKEGYSDSKRFAIMGAGYGGYATLAALTFTPDAFACGVDVAGPPDLNTLLAAAGLESETQHAMYARRMGLDAAFLKTQSPLFSAGEIKVPLLIGQGKNDLRARQRDSDQIVAAMRAKNVPVTYVVFPDEGHGFAKPENNRRFNAEVEAFLGSCLGGRVEPRGPSESIAPFLR